MGFVPTVSKVQEGILPQRLDEPHLGLEGTSGRLHAEVLGAQTQRGMAGVPCLGAFGEGGDGARFVSPLYPRW
jgi:hypothetical protein